jgi:signal transduction histidine kinase
LTDLEVILGCWPSLLQVVALSKPLWRGDAEPSLARGICGGIQSAIDCALGTHSRGLGVGENAGTWKSEAVTLFSKLPVRLASLILALMMIITTGVIACFTEAGVMDSRSWVLHTYEVKTNLEELQSTLNELRANGELYLLSNDKADLIHSLDEANQIWNVTSMLQRMTLDNPSQQRRLDMLQPLVDRQVAQLQEFAGTDGRSTPGGPEVRKTVDEISGRSEQIRSTVQAMQQEEGRLLQARLETWDALFRKNIITLGAAFAIAVILLIYNFRLLLAEIATRKEKERIERQSAESYRALSARILELQDVERRKIARELHDSVGQYLAGLKLNLGHLQAGKPPTPTDNPALLSETIELTDHAIGEVRTISHLLHPPSLDELGFDSAARWYVEGFSKRSGIEVRLHVGDIVERLPREIELALFRVLQEALTNVHRHANARSVDVEITCTDKKAVLVVRDDGKGIAQDVLQRFRTGLASGIGLAGMRERLAELGGTLEVESEGSGSILRATLPTNVCDSNDAKSAKLLN